MIDYLFNYIGEFDAYISIAKIIKNNQIIFVFPI